MNRREAERQTHQENVLMQLGFTTDEAESLRRISMTLHRWHERECGDDYGCIERDEETGKVYWVNALGARGSRYPIPDREKGAKNRLQYIVHCRNCRVTHGSNGTEPAALHAYIQTDPRGAALYILRPGDIPEGSSADSYYSRGVCVY